MKVFIDTNIPMYAAGKDHPHKNSCKEIMMSAATGKLKAYTDVEVFQEILYRFFYINRAETGYHIFDNFFRIMEGYILPVTPRDISLTRDLSETYKNSKLSPRDFVHLAVMLNNDIEQIITTDKGFSSVNLVKVVMP
jgi:uncharacterized protein